VLECERGEHDASTPCDAGAEGLGVRGPSFGKNATVGSPRVALLADVHAQEGQVEAGLATLAEALAAAQATGERWAEAELYRLRGSLLLQQTGTPQAEVETWLQQALDVARRQEARSLELRAAISLSRLWHQQGKQKEAHDLLAEVYAWLTEGFDTADLQEAKALLEELA
jgi:predicted ATPase